MKSLNQMDLEEWELLPDEGFLEINDDGGKKIYSRKYPKEVRSAFQMNYFICHPQKSVSEKFVENSRKLPNQHLLPVPFDVNPGNLTPNDHGIAQGEVALRNPIREIKIMKPEISEKTTSFGAVDQDQISQVFFKKMKEIEFVDIKVDSPKSNTSTTTTNKMIIPHTEGSGPFRFDKNIDSSKVESTEILTINKDNNMVLNLGENDDESGINHLWKWSLTGIGAICSFGVAVATVSIIIFSSQKRTRNLRQLQFQIYTDDKRIKQMVKLDEAVSRAHITVGGYYDSAAV